MAFDYQKYIELLNKLVAIATTLNQTLDQIKAQDPDVWEKVKGDYESASKAYREA